ncbi:efflux RND transporter periplasmic adaptor subunit [Lentibacillus salinarum]|uniref:Efflux RND transporter periplasmic adaptor subunit n=1 Tax=Lentibacillus salinarum TaxID=446820 RepID=A0ABW3ZY04_9BACI
MRKIGLSIAVIILLGILAACSEETEDNDDQEEQAIAVETAEVVKDDLVIEKSLYGRTEPDKTTPVMVQSPGEVTELEVENGDTVEEDDHLATIQGAAGNQTIYAQTDGEIANLTVEEEEMASDSDPLMVIADFDTMTLTFTVTAGQQNQLETDDTYTAVIDDQEYDVDITSISQMPDDTGLYPVEASVDNDDGDILSGMIAKLIVPEKKVDDSLILPTEAVVTESGETFVYVVEDNKAVKKDVTIQESQSVSTAVEGDIQESDQVVVNGLLTLSDGMNVNVVQEEDKS